MEDYKTRYESFCKNLDEIFKKIEGMKEKSAELTLIISELNNYIFGAEEKIKGMLSEKEKEEFIGWWTRMAPMLDNPEAIKLSEMRIAEKKAEEERLSLEDKVARGEFEIIKQCRIVKDQERRREHVARLQLKHCKELEGYDIDEFIRLNGQVVSPENRFSTPYGLVKFMEKSAPNMYKSMMNSYNQSMADKQALLIEAGHSFSGKSIKKFVK